MRSAAYILLPAGDMSKTIISPSIEISQLSIVSVQCVWTGNPVGNLILQASNMGDFYSDISPSLIAVNGPGDIIYTVSGFGYFYLQVYYQFINNSGTMKITVGKKGPS